MRPKRSKRLTHRVVVGLLLVSALAGLGWRALRPTPVLQASAVTAPGGAEAATAAASGITPAPVGPRAAAKGPAPAASVRVAAVARPDDGIPPDGLEICGVGRLTAAELRRLEAHPAELQAWLQRHDGGLEQRADLALARMAARLAAGSDRQQVAARLLMGDVEGAAALAAPSADPMAYQMALNACGKPGSRAEAPGCEQLSVQRWASLDPGDARPWLRLLGAAQGRGDDAAADAALAELASRTRLSPTAWLLETQVAPVSATEADPALRAHALVKVVGMDAARAGFDMSALSTACAERHPAYAQRLPQCRAAAAQLLAASGDLMDAALAQRVADRVGVPKSAQAHDAATLKAALSAWSEHAVEAVGLDCGAMQRMNQLSAERAARGELVLALGLLKRQPGR